MATGATRVRVPIPQEQKEAAIHGKEKSSRLTSLTKSSTGIRKPNSDWPPSLDAAVMSVFIFFVFPAEPSDDDIAAGTARPQLCASNHRP